MKTNLTVTSLLIGCLLTSPLVGQPASLPTESLPPEIDALNQADPRVADLRLSSQFSGFAGSEDNARALITGLRDGSPANLISTVNGEPVSTTIQPSVGKQGYGNVYLSLALAKDDLARHGVTNPTHEQIQAALNGGPLTVDGKTTQLPGILALRAQGQGWGQIAQQRDIRLGPVVSELRRSPAAAEHPQPNKSDKIRALDKPDRPVRPERIERPERPERPEKPERPHKPERAGKA